MASKLAAEKFTDLQDTTTSNSKVVLSKSFLVSRTTTVATEFAQLPVDAYIVGVQVSNVSGAASNAATTATVSVLAGAGATQITSVDVKTAASPPFAPLANLDVAAAAAGFSQVIKAVYAETGTASNTGGPWLVSVSYVI